MRLKLSNRAKYFSTLGLSLSFGLFSLACGPDGPPPLQTNYSSITSEPPGATVSFGTQPRGPFREIGVTPYTGTISARGHMPVWYAGYYKFVRDGYQDKVVSVGEEYGARRFHAILEHIPKFPSPPKVHYPSPESVAVSKLRLEANLQAWFKIKPGAKIAIMPFKSRADSGAGSLAADSMILVLQMRGFNVIDREQIERIMREQNLVASGKARLTDLEISKRIGKLVNVDYFIFGSVTEYSAKSENIALSPVISETDLERYRQDLQKFEDYWNSADKEPHRWPNSIQEWQIEYASKAKQSYINIARVGITAKIVDMKSTRIGWIGIANLSDLRLQQGMRRIINGMVSDYLQDRVQVETKPSKPAEQSDPTLL